MKFLCTILCASMVTAYAQEIHYRGNYNPSTYYSQNDVVQFGTGTYISNTNSNVGHQPDQDAKDWLMMNSTVYSQGQSQTSSVQSVNGKTGTAITLGYTDVGAAAAPVTSVSQAVTGPTYFVDSANGSDAAAGTSVSTAWKTLAKVNAASIASGSQVLLQSDGVWHEQLTAQTGVRYAAYGPQRSCTLSALLVAHCLHMPVIDGADALTGWTVQSGTTYKAPYTSTASKGFVDSLYEQTTPLTLQTSIANVNSTAGSIYSDGTYVYVHLSDGSNPANHTVEIAGSRSYGVNLNGAGTVVVEGLEIVRAAKSGVLGGTSSGSNNTVRSNVFFNIGDTLGDGTFGLGANAAEGAVFGWAYSPGITGWLIDSNYVGRMDFSASVLSYTQAGIDLLESVGSTISNNRIATTNGQAIQISDGFNSSTGLCTNNALKANEVVNSQGNLNNYGCSGTSIVLNSIHDSYGNVEIGGGFQTGDQTNSSPYLFANTISGLKPAYSNSLYNGIDVNHAINGVAVANYVTAVAASSMTLEADAGGSTGWQLYGNTFDASQDTYFDGTAATATNRVYPFYIRDTSNSAFQVNTGNNFVVNAVSPYIKYGATSASDQTHDVSLAVFLNGSNSLVGPLPQTGVSGNTDSAGTLTLSNGTGTYTFTKTTTVPNICVASDTSAQSAVKTSVTTTTLTVTGTGSDVVNYVCIRRN